MSEIKVWQDLIRHFRVTKRDNDLAYLLVFRFADVHKHGWVPREVFITTAIEILGVSRKTVLNNLAKLKAAGLVTENDKEILYYLGQQKIADLLQIEIRNRKAVIVKPSDLAGDLVTRRAFFESASMVTKDETIIISRAARKTVTGTSKRTQRKYDRIAGTAIDANYALLAKVSDLDNPYDLYYDEGIRNIFQIEHEGAMWYTRQIPNTYNFKQRLGTKRVRHGGKKVQLPNDFTPYPELYFDLETLRSLPPTNAYIKLTKRGNLFFAHRP